MHTPPKRDPHQLDPDITRGADVPGSRQTAHRDVERVRQEVTQNGPSPEKGQFQYSPKPWTPNMSEKDMRTTEFKSPKGSTVTVVTEKDMHGKPDFARMVTVNGRRMNEPAARQLLNDKFGVDL